LRKGIAGRYAAPSLLALLVLVSASSSRAQTPPRATPRPPVFGTGIEVINLNVSVTDARGRYVTDLTKNDFAVFEDGVRQELSIFNHEDIPISLVLMIDTSASMDEKLPTARAGRHPLRGHLAAPGQRPGHAVQRPHDDPAGLRGRTRRLENAISRTEAAGPTALHNALYVALKELEKQKTQGAAPPRHRAALGRRDTASLVSDDQVLDLARKTEINIYAISLRPRRMQDRNAVKFSQAAHLLTALTQDTGGQVHFPNSLSELDAVYDRIAEELRTQYSLGYVSNNGRRDGKWRRIVVRVPTREELQVRHKLGYFAVGTTTTSR
jgi:Ca-activated chloride channel family protein